MVLNFNVPHVTANFTIPGFRTFLCRARPRNRFCFEVKRAVDQRNQNDTDGRNKSNHDGRRSESPTLSTSCDFERRTVTGGLFLFAGAFGLRAWPGHASGISQNVLFWKKELSTRNAPMPIAVAGPRKIRSGAAIGWQGVRAAPRKYGDTGAVAINDFRNEVGRAVLGAPRGRQSIPTFLCFLARRAEDSAPLPPSLSGNYFWQSL